MLHLQRYLKQLNYVRYFNEWLNMEFTYWLMNRQSIKILYSKSFLIGISIYYYYYSFIIIHCLLNKSYHVRFLALQENFFLENYSTVFTDSTFMFFIVSFPLQSLLTTGQRSPSNYVRILIYSPYNPPNPLIPR